MRASDQSVLVNAKMREGVLPTYRSANGSHRIGVGLIYTTCGEPLARERGHTYQATERTRVPGFSDEAKNYGKSDKPVIQHTSAQEHMPGRWGGASNIGYLKLTQRLWSKHSEQKTQHNDFGG
ncbi:hypothetical protein BOTBODRAFT_41516 [Botryobasidium botryosum FD-172 SS1]|uniref:Uncharacterized protein n=1 Tax=Botryobasidium botryosum (strain FD-172 SS1) TaxID=930990 RepID=A0A067N607_BOTB1|nr:hypothetical protein BOTBODRAFT_41516 [Botryobasidium botryosum FD-172 SS1]